jgi:hypothetical protein
MLTEEMIAEISSFNIRELAKMHGRLLLLNSKKLDQIDQALGEIPLDAEKSTSMEGNGSDENSDVLKGNQIIRALVAGLFKGNDSTSMLDEDFLGGESKAAPMEGNTISRNDYLTRWQIKKISSDGFRFQEMMLEGPKDHSTSYMSFYLNSPQRLDDLLTEPNVPKLYLNIETACCLRVWLNGKVIFTQANGITEPVNLQIPLPLRKGNNHILMKIVNTDTDYVVKAFLSSSQMDFVERLVSTVELK